MAQEQFQISQAQSRIFARAIYADMVDIDNEEDGPILRIKDAKAICRDNNLPLAFYYQTFSYTKEHPKFRLGFVMDKPVRDEGMRKHIMEALVNLFPQSDKSCVNADRIFHGTNKTAKLFNENARISWENIEAVTFPTRPAEHHTGHSSHTEMRSDSELNELVQNFDFFGYLKERNGSFRRTSKGAVFHNCEICGHHDNLMYVAETNTFCCRSENKGGSIIDYLKYTEGLTTAQAIDKLKNELCEPRWSTPIPLDSVKLPVFPVKALPRPLRENGLRLLPKVPKLRLTWRRCVRLPFYPVPYKENLRLLKTEAIANH